MRPAWSYDTARGLEGEALLGILYCVPGNYTIHKEMALLSTGSTSISANLW